MDLLTEWGDEPLLMQLASDNDTEAVPPSIHHPTTNVFAFRSKHFHFSCSTDEERLQRPKQKSVYVGTDCGNVFGSTTKALVVATAFSKYNRLKTVYCPCHVMIFSSSMFRRRKASANESESHLLKNKRGQKKEKLIIWSNSTDWLGKYWSHFLRVHFETEFLLRAMCDEWSTCRLWIPQISHSVARKCAWQKGSQFRCHRRL